MTKAEWLKARAEAAAEELQTLIPPIDHLHPDTDAGRALQILMQVIKPQLEAKASLLSELAGAIPEWRPIREAPKDKRLITHKQGERGWYICAKREWPEGEDEFIAPDGHTTVTHSTFAPPTHFFDVGQSLPPPPAEGGAS